MVSVRSRLDRNCHTRPRKHVALDDKPKFWYVVCHVLPERGLPLLALLMHRRSSLNRPLGQGVLHLGNVQPLRHGLLSPAT